MKWRSPVFRFLLLFGFAVCIFPCLSGATTKKPPLRPININTATSYQLQLVPGIGPVTAKRIIEMRKSYGAFQSVDDLLAVEGIGPKKLEKMRKYLTVGKPEAPKPAKPSEPPSPPA